MKACAAGQHIKEATITVRKAGKGQQEFLIIKMNDVIITERQSERCRRCGCQRGARRAAVRQSRSGIQAAEGRRITGCRTSFQVRHQGQQGRVSGTSRASCAVDRWSSSPTTDRALSLDEALSIAILLQQNEQWAAAADIYRSILEVAPDHADALHFSGVLAHQQARSEQAVALIERSLELEPDRADWHSNLGIVLQDRLKLDEAIAAYRRAIALDPDHANAHNNLGVVLRATDKVVEAEAAYRAAIRIDPEHSDAYHNLGVLLNGQKRSHEAAVCFSKVITLRPKHPEARRLLAIAHCTLGEVDKAVEVFEEWLEEEPDSPIARHMLAACSGRDVPPRASDAFVEETFDSFAASFDSKLAQLSYRAPALVAEMLAESDVEASKSLDVLDAGCGTGLCGPLIAPYARRLVGVDLSAPMIAQARARNVYDELVKRELTAYLGDSTEAFDVIVSADTLVYFGLLEDVAAAAANALRPGGRLVFTVEELVGAGSADAGYAISPTGRYRHTRQYLERVLANANLRSEIVPAELRLEAGDPVPGFVVRGTKPTPCLAENLRRSAACTSASHGSTRRISRSGTRRSWLKKCCAGFARSRGSTGCWCSRVRACRSGSRSGRAARWLSAIESRAWSSCNG